MAKYRHKIFDMYEYEDEAIKALSSKTAPPVAEAATPEPWTFKHLAVSRADGVTLVQFRELKTFEAATVGELRTDFIQLAERLAGQSRVLLNFAGVTSFNAASLDILVLFNEKLKASGSRMAMCSFNPATRETFLPMVDRKPYRRG